MRAVLLALMVALALLLPASPVAAQAGSPAALAEPATMERDRQRSAKLSKAERDRALRLFEEALLLWKSGDFEAAKVGFERGLGIDPANGVANYYLGDVLSRLGDREGARARWQRAVAFDPDSGEGLKAQVALDKLPPPPKPLPPKGTVLRDCADCPELVVVPAGSFLMGSPAGEQDRSDDQGPRHEVRIDRALAVGKHEVTVAEYGAFVRESGHAGGSACFTYEGGEWWTREGRGWRNPGFAQGERHPVVCVSWDDARAYVQWLSGKTGQRYRLPSEAEWEYAARGGTTTRRYWGDDLGDTGLCGHANGPDMALKRRFDVSFWGYAPCDDGHVHTAPTGSFRANAFGLYDMLGNASEWTEDCWNASYAGAPEDGSAWTTGDCSSRVQRGGSWNINPWYLRGAYRSRTDTGSRHINAGFRVARTY